MADWLDLQFFGQDVLIRNISTVREADEASLSFSKNDSGSIGHVKGVTICKCECEANVSSNAMVKSSSPRFDFIRALDYLEKEIGFDSYGAPSTVHYSAKLGKNVVIEEGCVIAENVVLEHNVVIHKGTKIGKNSRIRANSSIGGDGFGFERFDDGTPIRFVHLGGVVIGENVEIGSNACIVRGTLSDTIIENNVKIDNLVHLSHNCHVEEGAFIIACAEVSGGVRIGKHAWVGPNASIIQQLNIGERAMVGIASNVLKNVAAKTVVAGNPARLLELKS